MNREDPFSGNWRLNPEKSNFDPNHRPASATMSWERTPQGYSMKAEGTTSDGQVVQERPTSFILDGQDHVLPDVPRASAIMRRPDAKTIHVESRNGNRVIGKAEYVVSDDGATMTAAVSGIDAQQRPFETVLVWDRK